jgi:hypothetical protein
VRGLASICVHQSCSLAARSGVKLAKAGRKKQVAVGCACQDGLFLKRDRYLR